MHTGGGKLRVTSEGQRRPETAAPFFPNNTMRIVDLPTFLALPTGTLFAKYQPCVFDELRVKGDNCGDVDFFYRNLFDVEADCTDEFFEALEKAREDGSEVKLEFDGYGRDGLYNRHQLFAVFSEADVNNIINALKQDQA